MPLSQNGHQGRTLPPQVALRRLTFAASLLGPQHLHLLALQLSCSTALTSPPSPASSPGPPLQGACTSPLPHFRAPLPPLPPYTPAPQTSPWIPLGISSLGLCSSCPFCPECSSPQQIPALLRSPTGLLYKGLIWTQHAQEGSPSLLPPTQASLPDRSTSHLKLQLHAPCLKPSQAAGLMRAGAMCPFV